ncbi:uncharacterized protein METZ01_LOCUS111489 [marine metagenome]|uniref:Glycerophosphoryl diester phosphodiesterase membrane domain-containing protein n=1 Tax=marine metagenome TaxID=408172 RepID=A0A381X1M1_9ZZZZ
MGFFDTIGRGWTLSKLSFSVVKADPELLLYTFLSAMMVFVTIAAAAYPGYEAEIKEGSHWAMTDPVTNPETGEEERQATSSYMAWIFLTYMVGSIIVVFWNSAIIVSAHERLTGGDPTIMTGIKAAFSRIHIIILWGIIAGTVGLLLRIARDAISNEKAPAALKILASIMLWIVEVAWWIYTFFIIPMIVLEKKGIREGLRDSRSLFGKTWGENVTSGLGIGLITLFGIIVSLLIGYLIFMISPIAGIVIAAALIGILILWTNTAEVVVVAALYEYAKTGKMPDLNGNGSQFEEALPWESKSGWANESAETKAWREGTG